VSGDKNILDAILSALGFNPTQLRWRWRRSKQSLSNWLARTENRSRAVHYEHKTCHACNAPVDRDEKTCPRCGVALAGATADRAGRLLRFIVPEGALVYTTLMGIMIVALFGAMIMKGGAQMLWPGSSEAMKRQILISLNLGASHVGYFDLGRLCHDLRIENLSHLCPDFPHVHRLVTSMFVHFGVMHFLFNIYALLQLGPLLEKVYGRSRFLVLYFLCGVGGSAVSIWWHWENPGAAHAGASGALFGLIGASLIYGWRSGGAFGRSLASEMLRWGVFALIFSLMVKADNAAHLGGAAVGASLGFVLPDQTTASRIPPKLWSALELLCLLALVGSFVALFALDDPIYSLYRKAWFKG
jgi:membrane associated rhomboid family serine protease/ribosomal protein S27AE